jgi:thiamine-monophosphate kinase
MRLTKIGEFGLIERFKKRINLDSSVIKGSGDDCAVIKFNKNKYMLFTCDMIVEGVDFTTRTNPYLVGRKALAVSISDIAACGGVPAYCLVSLGLKPNSSLELADKIFKGLRDLAREFKINIVGGDISRADKLTIDVSLIGFVEKKYLVLRSQAKVGDKIFVTGSLGGSLKNKHLKFIPRVREARFLVKNFKINSMIDISDGLVQDMGHILKQSNVGAVVYEGLIPKSKQAKSIEDSLYSGEDFELLFSLSHKEAKRLLAKNLKVFRPIGEIVDKKQGLRLIDKHSREKQVKARGFRHF